MDWSAVARLAAHSVTIIVAAMLLIDSLKWGAKKLDLIVWGIHITTIVVNLLLANYWVGILGGWYTPATDGPRLVRIPGLFITALLPAVLILLKQQRDMKRYWREMYYDQLDSTAVLRDALKEVERLREIIVSEPIDEEKTVG